jgi:hypothetical protein
MKWKPELMVLVVALLAMAAKIYCAATTIGTCDVLYFSYYGHFLWEEGVVDTYNHIQLFNLPPSLGNYVGLIHYLAAGNMQRFALYQRLPGIAADFLVVLLVLWIRRRTGRPPWWAIGLLAGSPVSFMISGYHGNYDSLIPLGLTLVVVACMIDRALVAGVLLAVACQVKIIPIMLSPVFFFYWWQRGQARAWTFTGATVFSLLIMWSAPLLGATSHFTHQVLLYNSVWGWWGIPYLFHLSGLPGLGVVLTFRPPTHEQALATEVLKFLVIAGTLIVAWRRRKRAASELMDTVGLVWVIFFTLAPGFGPQYLAWVGPFLLFYQPRGFAVLTAAASYALFVFYNVVSGGVPWSLGYYVGGRFNQWAPWLLLPWAVFLALLIASKREFGLVGARSAAAGDEAAELADATASS